MLLNAFVILVIFEIFYRHIGKNLFLSLFDKAYSNNLEVFLLLLKKVGSARLRESVIHLISLKTPAPQYQPIDRKTRKGKRVEDNSRDRAV